MTRGEMALSLAKELKEATKAQVDLEGKSIAMDSIIACKIANLLIYGTSAKSFDQDASRDSKVLGSWIIYGTGRNIRFSILENEYKISNFISSQSFSESHASAIDGYFVDLEKWLYQQIVAIYTPQVVENYNAIQSAAALFAILLSGNRVDVSYSKDLPYFTEIVSVVWQMVDMGYEIRPNGTLEYGRNWPKEIQNAVEIEVVPRGEYKINFCDLRYNTNSMIINLGFGNGHGPTSFRSDVLYQAARFIDLANDENRSSYIMNLTPLALIHSMKPILWDVSDSSIEKFIEWMKDRNIIFDHEDYSRRTFVFIRDKDTENEITYSFDKHELVISRKGEELYGSLRQYRSGLASNVIAGLQYFIDHAFKDEEEEDDRPMPTLPDYLDADELIRTHIMAIIGKQCKDAKYEQAEDCAKEILMYMQRHGMYSNKITIDGDCAEFDTIEFRCSCARVSFDYDLSTPLIYIETADERYKYVGSVDVKPVFTVTENGIDWSSFKECIDEIDRIIEKNIEEISEDEDSKYFPDKHVYTMSDIEDFKETIAVNALSHDILDRYGPIIRDKIRRGYCAQKAVADIRESAVAVHENLLDYGFKFVRLDVRDNEYTKYVYRYQTDYGRIFQLEFKDQFSTAKIRMEKPSGSGKFVLIKKIKGINFEYGTNRDHYCFFACDIIPKISELRDTLFEKYRIKDMKEEREKQKLAELEAINKEIDAKNDQFIDLMVKHYSAKYPNIDRSDVKTFMRQMLNRMEYFGYYCKEIVTDDEKLPTMFTFRTNKFQGIITFDIDLNKAYAVSDIGNELYDVEPFGGIVPDDIVKCYLIFTNGFEANLAMSAKFLKDASEK